MDVSPAHYEKVFLCNSGTESVEAAIKAARTTTGKTEIISLIRGFHDKSLGNLSATWDKNYQELFMPLVPGFTHVPANKLDKLEAALTSIDFIIEEKLLQRALALLAVANVIRFLPPLVITNDEMIGL